MIMNLLRQPVCVQGARAKFSHILVRMEHHVLLFCQEFGIEYWMCGENIAAGQRTPEQVMNGWMNSPGHRQNIMGPYTHIGVGYYVDKNGRMNWVQLFIGK